jgi:hypothetical protein
MFGEAATPPSDAAPKRGGPRAKPEDENTQQACFHNLILAVALD